MKTERPLAAFYEGLDRALGEADGTTTLMAQLTDDFEWEISLPDKLVSGDRAKFADFLEARARAKGSHAASHRVVLSTRDGAREVVMGYLEAENAPPSPFMAAASIDEGGRISRLMLRRSTLDL